jgi:release factor glutamine methyltransferase
LLFCKNTQNFAIILTIREAYLKSRETLSSIYEDQEGSAICKRMFEDVFMIPANTLLSKGDLPFTKPEKLEICLQRLLAHEPIQHIAGFEMFCGLKIGVSPDVLIPRPETEELVEWMLADLQGREPQLIADICTGSGCIAIALKDKLPTSNFMATDISSKTLEMAKENELSNFEKRSIQFEQHDIIHDDWIFAIPDVIACNPPYIALPETELMEENVLAFEPNIALFVENDPLLFYKRIIELFRPHAKTVIYFELNPLTAADLRDFCKGLDIESEFRKDMQGKTRFARISL